MNVDISTWKNLKMRFMMMKIKIKLSSGKTMNLTGEELRELLSYEDQESVYCLVFHY